MAKIKELDSDLKAVAEKMMLAYDAASTPRRWQLDEHCTMLAYVALRVFEGEQGAITDKAERKAVLTALMAKFAKNGMGGNSSQCRQDLVAHDILPASPEKSKIEFDL